MPSTARLVRWGSLVALVAAVLAIVTALPLGPVMSALKEWIATLGVWGPLAFAAIYVVAALLLIPGTVLTLAAGAVFGLLVGFLTVSLAATTTAACGFLIARYFARSKVEAAVKSNAKFDAIDRAIEEGGWKVVGMLRLSPAIPFNFQNYLYGLTKLRFWPYLLTSWITMMPGTLMYVYLGHLSGAALGGEREKSPAEWALLVVGLLATIGVTVYLTRLAKQKLNERTDVAADSPDGSLESTVDGAVDGKLDVAAPEASSSVDEPAEPARVPWKLAAAAGVLVVAAVLVRAKQDDISKTVSGWLDSSAVTLNERPAADHRLAVRLAQRSVDAGSLD